MSVSLPESIDFKLDPVRSEIAKVAYGRCFDRFAIAPGEGDDRLRHEVDVAWEDVTGDEMRQNRLVATATLSQKITKNTTFSLGAVYANRPEYRGEGDEEVSARFGFKWSVDKKEEDKKRE